MSTKYYLRNLYWGVTGFCITVYFCYLGENKSAADITLYLTLAGISTILYPFSKRLTEKIALFYTKKEFWYRDYFSEDVGKNGLYAIYYIFCFIFSIPLGISYLIILTIIKNPTAR
ncbi:Colicin E1 (microcin) immunity protein [Yersinia mollaretii]|uniref:colicin E1 family microcin immunity protein n=1 Tax=Yersinia mollaretii TaxID=33060 RepID=UPI0005DC96D1|nr:Colicin E1 (microcin) immunity protein [Yersinia mollaretii]